MRTTDGEARREQLRGLGRELHVPVPEAFWGFEVRNRDGRVVRERRQPSHSWVRWLYNHMFTQVGCIAIAGADGLNLVKTDGADLSNPGGNLYTYRPGAGTYPAEGLEAPMGEDTYGIVVGTGSVAESFEDHALGSKIANGTGAGQLSHIAAEDYAVSTVGTTWSVEHARYFNNNSGAAITVNEVGLYAHTACYMGGGGTVMICRDLISGGVEVPDTGQLKVTYTVQLTYPA